MSGEFEQDLAQKVLAAAEPASVGLFFQAVRARGLRAGDEATDFGQLFLGFSIFLIVAALLLTALVFVFGVESRSEQTGMLLAVGFSPGLARRMLLAEGAVLALLGAVGGTWFGLLYTRGMIWGLATVWRVAVSSSIIHFYAKLSTLLVGALVGVAISLTAIWLTLRKQVSQPARELLVGNVERQSFSAKPVSKGKFGILVAALAAIGAAVLLVSVGTGDSEAAAIAFFGAGALLLIMGLGLTQALLRMAGSRWTRPMASLAGLGLRNSTRRAGRSLAVVALLACGTFLVIAVGANRHDPLVRAEARDSGTGGFVFCMI
jgi:hypothetical protein